MVTSPARVRFWPGLAEYDGLREPSLLVLLAEHGGYGYELAAELEERGLVSTPVTTARVYEVLNRLEEEDALG